MNAAPPEDPRLVAGVELLRRTGALQIQLRYSDDEDPVIWMAAAMWSIGGDGKPRPTGGRPGWAAGAGMEPVDAVLALCDKVLDGGYCTHCERPTGVTLHWSTTMPLAEVICWYVYDPETQRFRRSCEGDDA